MKRVLAVCGVKNSGKTTLIEKIVRELSKKGMKIAVIKHDGHDFVPDVPGTDSFRFQKAGAQTVAVYSPFRCMVIQNDAGGTDVEELVNSFQETDLILIEGLKNSSFPKIEIVRKGISEKICSDVNTLQAIATDWAPSGRVRKQMEKELSQIPILSLNDLQGIIEWILKKLQL